MVSCNPWKFIRPDAKTVFKRSNVAPLLDPPAGKKQTNNINNSNDYTNYTHDNTNDNTNYTNDNAYNTNDDTNNTNDNTNNANDNAYNKNEDTNNMNDNTNNTNDNAYNTNDDTNNKNDNINNTNTNLGLRCAKHKLLHFRFLYFKSPKKSSYEIASLVFTTLVITSLQLV